MDSVGSFIMFIMLMVSSIGCIHANVSRSQAGVIDVRECRTTDSVLGQFRRPHGVVVMRTGAVWVADTDNHRQCLID